MRKLIPLILLSLLLIFCHKSQQTNDPNFTVTKDDGNWLFLNKEDVSNGTYHTKHAEVFGKYVSGYNVYVLRAIDIVQSTAPDGGGYFIGIHADPPESPIGYNLQLFDKPLLEAPRPTSYCSGSTYAAFIESLNLMFKNRPHVLSGERYEALNL
ncbi:MAG: hypothetical protein GXO74_00775 [Calditrichaeota bacterium]|nr:hypothetical protein [Calditrichota bacterium]